MKKKKILTIGGGTGQFALLSGLKKIENIEIVAVASMVDSGGSSGRLRAEWGVLPPSDLYRCILALSPYSESPKIRDLLLHRFQGVKIIRGHTIGNMVLTMLSRYSGDILLAVKALSSWLEIKGKVFPVTKDNAHLVAISQKGKIYSSEDALGKRKESSPIEKIFLSPPAKVLPAVRREIKKADLVVIGPGDLYTSLIPNLLVKGVKEALQKAKGKIVFVLNIMTRFAETHQFKASDHLFVLEKFLGRKIDYLICNSRLPRKTILKEYKKEKAFPVENDLEEEFQGRRIIKANLLTEEGNIARHDSRKLALLVASL